ncbi:MAG: hypothetical protein U0Q22_15900 [Acidimicrobiales bacterium]
MTNTSSISTQLRELAAPLAGIVGELMPDAVPLPDAPDVWAAFVELRRLADAGAVLMSARVNESRRWAEEGAASAAEWMALEAGVTVGRSRADLGTSGRLGELPLTAGELRAGNLSAEQADAVSDAATANPAAERDLLDRARRESLKGLREEAERRKAQAERDPEAKRRRIHRERSVRSWVKGGVWHLFARGPVDLGAEVQQTIERLVDERYRHPAPEAEREPREAYAFDGLVELSRLAARGGSFAGRSAAGGGDGVSPAATRTTESIKRLMVIRVDLAALVRGAVGGDEVCEIDGLGPIPVTEARLLMGECILKAVVTNGVAVANVTHLGRGPTVAQKIAMLWNHAALQSRGLQPDGRAIRPPHRLAVHPAHPARRDRSTLHARPRQQDVARMGAGRGQRPAPDGAARSSPAPGNTS